VNFFTDENISEYLARMIALFDRDSVVQPHCDHFPKGTSDAVWIPAVSSWNPRPSCVIGDGRILKTPALRIVAKQSEMTFIVMGESFMNLPWEEQAWRFIKMWPSVVKAVSAIHRPTIFDVGVKSLKVQSRMSLSQLSG